MDGQEGFRMLLFVIIWHGFKIDLLASHIRVSNMDMLSYYQMLWHGMDMSCIDGLSPKNVVLIFIFANLVILHISSFFAS